MSHIGDSLVQTVSAGLANIAETQVSRRAMEVQRTIEHMDPLMASRFDIGDPFSVAAVHKTKLGEDGHVVRGHIHYTMPYVGWYQVALDDGHGMFPCCKLTNDTGCTIAATIEATVLPPDTPVLVWVHPKQLWGVILGVHPTLIEDANITFPDNVVQASNVGIQKDNHHQHYLTALAEDGGVSDFSNNKPLDQTVLDWGRATALGAAFHLDPFMIYMRMDETCGIFGYYFDRLLRIAGYNLDLRSAGYEEQHRNDEGEIQISRGETPYPHEALGILDPLAVTSAVSITTDEDVQFGVAKAKLEPSVEDQQPFFRYQEYGGYLGQAHIRQVALPPDSVAINRLSDTQVIPGVFREMIGLDGTYALETAKRLVLAKRSLIPMPKRTKIPESYEGSGADNTTNYKAAGLTGSGAEHKVGDITNPNANTKAIAAAVTNLDTQSYIFNWQALHPFFYHENDFDLPEEKDLPLEKVQELPAYSPGESWLPDPLSHKMKVDERYGDVDFYKLLSHLTFTDDGGVVIQGGAGEEIRMVRGNIQISAPYNIFIQPGKSVVLLGGDDVVIRAKNSVDVTAASHDVSIKAERNLRCLGGNSGEGGVMIESRGSGDEQGYDSDTKGEDIKSSGIVLKAASSQIACLGHELYLRTGVGELPGGDVVIDAGAGDADIRFVGGTIESFMRSQRLDSFGLPGAETVNRYRSSLAQIGSSLDVNGSLRTSSFLVAAEQITTIDGKFASGQAGDGLVQQLKNPDADRANIQKIQSNAKDNVADGTSDYQERIETKFYEQGKIGNAEQQSKISYSCRTPEQYATTDFKLPQMTWQLMAAAQGLGHTWQEPIVVYGESEQLMPYPGKEKWDDEETFLMVPDAQLKMFDLHAGSSVDRGEAYETATLPTLSAAKPSDNYLILG